MDAEKVARLLGAEKVIVAGNKISLFGLQKELADEVLKLIELITPGNCFGYAIANGEGLVFRRGELTVVAFVEDDRVIGTLRRLTENV